MFQACTVQTWVKVGSIFVIQSANWTISKYFPSCWSSLARIQRAFAINPRKPPSATVVNASTGGALDPRPTPRVNPSSREARCWFNEFWNCATSTSSTAAAHNRKTLWTRPLISGVRLRRGEFPPCEGDNPNDGEDPAEQNHNLTERGSQLSPADAPPAAERINGRKTLHQFDNPQQTAKQPDHQRIKKTAAASAGFVIQTKHRALRHDGRKGST